VTLPVILQVFERIPPHLTVPEWIASSTGAVAYSLPGWEMYTTSISPCTPTPKAPEKELPPMSSHANNQIKSFPKLLLITVAETPKTDYELFVDINNPKMLLKNGF
jgi:hypothetical protein